MASKIVARLGTKAQFLSMPVPLLVGEYGYESDTRNGVVGDGSTTPPEFMTTKSNGGFDFTGTTTVNFNNISANSYNGVNLAQINAANGLITRTANGVFAARTLTSTDSSINIMYPDGVGGNPNLKINPNLDLSSGTGSLVLPQGTQAQRPVNPEVGALRYCIDPSNNYSIPEIYSADNAWHSLKEYVYNGDYVLTVNPNAPANTSQTYTTIQQALLRHLLIDCSGKSIVSIPEGVFQFANTVQFNNSNKQWSIKGVAPLSANLMGVAGVTGTNGLWTVVLNLDNVSGINVGNYLIVDSLRGYSTQPHRGFGSTVSGSPTISAATGNTTSFIQEVNVNDYVTVTTSNNGGTFLSQKYTGKVTAIPNASTLQLNSNVGFSTLVSSIYSSFAITGSVYSNPNNPTNIVGVGTIFTQELNVNDIIVLGGETKQIIAISSDSSLVVANPPVSWPTTAASALTPLANNNPELHQGSFKIVAVDTVNKKVTVLNNCQHQPPVNKLGVGTVKIIKSVISFTNPTSDGFLANNGASLDLQNLMIISASGTGSRGISVMNSNITLESVFISGFNGVAASGLNVDQNSTCLITDNTSVLNISNCTNGITCTNGSIVSSNNPITINSCSSDGVLVDFSAGLLCTPNNTGSWRLALSIVDCFCCVEIGNNSYVYVSILHTSYCTGPFAVQVYYNSVLLTTFGTVIHDCSSGGLNCQTNSFCNVPNSYIFNMYLVNGAVYGIACGFGSSVLSYNSTFSNVVQALGAGNNSNVLALSSFFYACLLYNVLCYNNSSINCAGSTFSCTNGSTTFSSIVLYVAGGSYGVFDYCSIAVTSTTITLIAATNGSFASALYATFYGSTLLSPPKNTVGNGNSFISN